MEVIEVVLFDLILLLDCDFELSLLSKCAKEQL